MCSNFVYILYSNRIDRYYIGQTHDVEERLIKHNTGYYEDKWSEKGKPWVVFMTIECETKPQAIAIERHIKNMKSRVYIENLKKYPEIIVKLKQKFSSLDS